MEIKSAAQLSKISIPRLVAPTRRGIEKDALALCIRWSPVVLKNKLSGKEGIGDAVVGIPVVKISRCRESIVVVDE